MRQDLTMLHNYILAATLLVMALSGFAYSQAADRRTSRVEEQIRKLDLAAAKAILTKDEAAIDRYFAPDSITNNPRGGITLGNAGVRELLKTGVIDYGEFTREIETVQVRGGIAVVMGSETIATRARNGGSAETYRRRYTNVWAKRKGRWQIIARHASVICPPAVKP